MRRVIALDGVSSSSSRCALQSTATGPEANDDIKVAGLPWVGLKGVVAGLFAAALVVSVFFNN